jgi:hypothetical protein
MNELIRELTSLSVHDMEFSKEYLWVNVSRDGTRRIEKVVFFGIEVDGLGLRASVKINGRITKKYLEDMGLIPDKRKNPKRIFEKTEQNEKLLTLLVEDDDYRAYFAAALSEKEAQKMDEEIQQYLSEQWH